MKKALLILTLTLAGSVLGTAFAEKQLTREEADAKYGTLEDTTARYVAEKRAVFLAEKEAQWARIQSELHTIELRCLFIFSALGLIASIYLFAQRKPLLAVLLFSVTAISIIYRISEWEEFKGTPAYSDLAWELDPTLKRGAP